MTASGDSVIPGYGNPAASLTVKFYLTAVKEEQLLARTVPIQVETLLILFKIWPQPLLKS